MPGRQTDKAEARWLAKLMRDGLLRASFVPPLERRDWRGATRYRTTLVQEHSREIHRVQGVLARATIKLAEVATDITGVSARAILAALVEGRSVFDADIETCFDRLDQPALLAKANARPGR